MEEISKVYKYVDGIKDLPFPNSTNQLEIKDFTYDAKRMGGTPTISTSVKYPTCLDDLWSGKEFVEFRGEKYVIKYTPSSSYSNDDNRYKHDITFVSERIILDNTYFYDVVTDPTDVDKYVSNSSKLIFFGDIHEFSKRLDYSLKYSKVGYTVVVDDGISTEGFTMSFEDQFFSQVLQSTFEVYGIPYYFVGKVIHIGYTNNAITHTFKYGVDDALLSISKTNANYKIVNRITGSGSSDNIPYYYPNPSDKREEIEEAGGEWITPSEKLMPPIYRETLGSDRFYNAENGTYKDPITGEYYIFENEYVDGNPKEHKVAFDHIKPTIKEMVNAAGLRIDMFEAFDYDANDNDDTDEEGKYIHPYFFGKLRKLDGANGFNLFAHAIEEDEMIISMTSGSCGACNFVIGVDDDTQKNPVQVHTNGELLRDKDGNVIRSGRPQPAQQDTLNNSVWIALRKDEQTFGVLMPNATNNYKPNALTDTFVILHIDLPQAYITSAENKLKEEVIKYMATNNSDKFNFSINFSRIFFAENPDILSQLNENARLQIEYNKKLYELYISSYSYKMSSNEPLPQITVELSDTLTINKGTLQTSIDAVKQDIMSSIGGSVDFLKQGLKYFVRKDVKDYARFVDFREGIDVGGFESLISGGTFRKDIDGKSYIEVDRLYVRLKAIFENLEIKRTTYVGGEQIASPAAMKCIKVEDKGTFYRCYYLNEQEGVKIQNEFVVGDQAICKEANLASGSNVSNQYYWRLVTGVGDGYIDLSKSDCDTGSTVPAAGDDIVQLGNRNDATRQKAIIQSTVSLDAPSIKLLAGINSFSLGGKAIISMGFDSLTGKATFNVYGNAYIGNPDGSSFIRYTPEGGVEINAKLSIGTTIGDGNETVIDKINQAKQDAIEASGKELTDYAATVTKDIKGLQNQIDGAIETWFEDPIPTLTNKPAIDWNTIELKNLHLGDIYYSGEGKIYRFQMEGTSYVWKEVIDTELAKALELAKKAQDTADGKRKVFVRQPLNTEDYAVGDLWVNATFATIYKNDLLRCKTAKAANVAFNIVHWELASKYTDDTKALEAAVAAANAQATADAAQDASDVVAGNVSDLNDYVDGAFKDGLITEAEAQAIATYINTINNNKQSADNQYSKLYANVYLAGTAKTNLASSKTALDTATTNLISSINAAIKDGKTTVAEKEDVDAKFALYNTANATFSTRIEEANKAIQDKLKTYSDEAAAAAAAAAVTAGNAQKSANEANAAVGSLNTYIDGAFKDGVVSEAEAAAIEKYINSVNNTKSEVKATFDKLYANVYLAGTAKTDLNAKYTALNSSITNLLASINTAIADGKTTTVEKTDVDAKFSLFNTAYAAFSTSIETANKAIQDKLKDYSDAASEAASNAQNSANTAQSSANTANNLLSDIASDSKLTASEKQETKKEWDIIVSEKAKNDASADFYGVSKTAYGTAYTALSNYITPLLASLTTTSNIVGTTFRSKFKAYYDARTDLLNSISKKAKELADSAQSSADKAIKDIAGYSYIADALKQPPTTVDGGLILSSLVSLGYKPSSTTPFKVMSGINGIYDAKKPGNGISYWSGGSMKDLAEDFPLPWNTIPKPTDPTKYATSVIRMDGTVYHANGNFWIDVDGKVHCDPLSFFVGTDQVGNILTLFTPVTTGTGTAKRVVGARQNVPFEDGTGKGRLLIGKYILSEDDKGNLALTKSDGTEANFYTTGGLSCLGLDIEAGGGGSNYDRLDTWESYTDDKAGYVLSAGLGWGLKNRIVALENSSITSVAWSIITGKPTTIAGYGITDAVINTDARLTNARPASDVYAWAKASVKPSYNFTEISDGNINLANAAIQWYRNTDYASISFKNTGDGDTDSYLRFEAGDNGDEGFAFFAKAITTEYRIFDIFRDRVQSFYNVTAPKFIKAGGTSTQLLRADGEVATFNWLGQNGQPTWLWGGNGYNDYKVYNPSNFRVANAETLTGFTSGNVSKGERNTNNCTENGLYYVTSNYPSGMTTGDGALYVQAYNSTYVAQIAQDYRNGDLQVRGKDNGTWKTWYKVLTERTYASIADSRYVKKSGDTMTGSLTAPTLNVDQPGETLIRYYSGGTPKTATGWRSPHGSYLYNYPSAKYLGILDSGTPHFQGNTLWHAGNDGSGSGLDADMLDGYHRTDMFTSMNEVFKTWGQEIEIEVGGDSNTYYPVVIDLPTTKTWVNRISVYKNLGSKTANYPGNHPGGWSSMWAMYEARHTGWDGNNGFLVTKYNSFDYAQLIADAHTIRESVGDLVVCLRGGGTTYRIATDYKASIKIYYTNTNVGSSTYPNWVKPITTIGNGGTVNTASLHYVVNSATKLQTPRTINGTSFDGTANIVTSYWGTTRTLSAGTDCSGSVSVNGSGNFTLPITVNTATKLRSNRINYKGVTDDNVVGQLMWKQYGGGHTIFDASNSTTPSGTSCSNSNPDVSWSPHYPTLMGWNGNNTYGVKVDYAERCTRLENTRTIWGQNFNGTGNITGKAYVDQRVGGAPTISLAIGDNDTGLNWVSDGVIRFVANGVESGYWSTTELYTSKELYGANVRAHSGYLFSTSSGNTIQIGCRNSSHCHYETSAPSHWFNAGLSVNGNIVPHSGRHNLGSANDPFGQIYASEWFRTTGSGGWYSQKWGGGIHMEDTIWVRIYGGKNFYVSSTSVDAIHTAGGINASGRGYFGGALTTTGTLTVSGRASFADVLHSLIGIYSDGYVSAKGLNTSDIRLKTDINDFKGIDIIKQLSPKSYHWNNTARNIGGALNTPDLQYGLIAQQSQGIIDGFVVENMFNDGYYGIRYEKLLPIMLKAQIETIDRIETIEDKIERLEKDNAMKEKRIKELERRLAYEL